MEEEGEMKILRNGSQLYPLLVHRLASYTNICSQSFRNCHLASYKTKLARISSNL